MKKYTEFISRFRKPLIILLALINIFAIIGIFRIKLSPSFDIFVPDDSIYSDNMSFMEKYFDSSSELTFIVKSSSSTLDENAISEFQRIQEHIGNTEGVSDVEGPSTFAGQIQDPAGLQEYYDSIGKLSPVAYTDDGMYGIFQVFIDDSFKAGNINNIQDWLDDNGLSYYISGDVYMQHKIIDYLIRILLTIPPLALFLILFVFNTRIKTIKGTLMSVLPAGIGALWTLGTIGWTGTEVSIITILAPIFTIVIGSADGLHFVTHVQESRKEGNGKVESIAATLKMVGIPMIITTVTSMAGFLSLLAFNSSAMDDLAIYASLGIMLAGIATWYVLPLFLSGNIRITSKKTAKERNLLNLRKLWGTTSVVVSLVLVIVASFGIPSIKTEFNMLMVYKHNTEVNRSFEKAVEINGGGVPEFIIIKAEDSIMSPGIRDSVKNLQTKLESFDYVGKTVSIYDAVPAGMQTAAMDPSTAEKLGNLADLQDNVLRVMVFPTGFENKILDNIESTVTEFSEENPGLDVRITGTGYLMRDLNRNMLRNQSKSLVLAFGLIILLLFISLRKIIPALLAVVPIGVTVVVLYGFLGFSGISLNVFTATIFCITIGVGIDYAVHFTSVFMEFRKTGSTKPQALEKAYKYTSKPIIANALGISFGLSALFLSPLKIHSFVAILMWVSMICGVFLSLSFLPTILGMGKEKHE